MDTQSVIELESSFPSEWLTADEVEQLESEIFGLENFTIDSTAAAPSIALSSLPAQSDIERPNT